MTGETVSAAALRRWVGRPLNLVTVARIRRRVVRDREVLYPDDGGWEATVAGVRIEGMPRYEAAEAYTQAVSEQVPALSRLSVEPFLGDPRSPVYAEPVSLSPQASVLEHLVELLGEDPDLVFTIEPGGEERLLLRFEHASEVDR